MSHHQLMVAIKRRRENLLLTQQDMADLIGVSRRHYVRCESGKSELRLSQFAAALRVLKITYLDLALDMMNLEPVSPEDVTASARTLSPSARKSLIKFLLDNWKDKKKGA